MIDQSAPFRISRGSIIVEGLELHAFHGCFAHERKYGQSFSIDLCLVADLRQAALSDDLAVAIDYGKVVSVLEKTFCGKRRRLVEAAAFDIAQTLLDSFARIEAVIVKVAKVAPPIPARMRAAGVEIEVRRSN